MRIAFGWNYTHFGSLGFWENEDNNLLVSYDWKIRNIWSKMSWDNKGLMNAIDYINDVVMEEYEELICKGTFIKCFSASQ